MYIFAEPVTEEEADSIQSTKQTAQKAFARDIVGINRNDPEIQKEWHDIQDHVDTEVDEDEIRGQVEDTEEVDETESDDATLVENEDSTEDAEAVEDVEKNAVEEDLAKTPTGPLMGWTLAVRNRVNGVYVERPENISPEDKWTVEYHIKEIAPEARWNLYSKVKDDRQKLIGRTEEGENTGLENYRRIIRNFSNRGRRWREQQDMADDQAEKQVFQPLGPGSEAEDKSNV